jgi:hypothetical protein
MNLPMVEVGEVGVYSLRMPVFDFGFGLLANVLINCKSALQNSSSWWASLSAARHRLPWSTVASSVHTVFYNPDGRRQCFAHYPAKLQLWETLVCLSSPCYVTWATRRRKEPCNLQLRLYEINALVPDIKKNEISLLSFKHECVVCRLKLRASILMIYTRNATAVLM